MKVKVCAWACVVREHMRYVRPHVYPFQAYACTCLLQHTHANSDNRTAVVVSGHLGRKLNRGGRIATKGATNQA